MLHWHKPLLLSTWLDILFSVQFNSFDQTTGFYGSYTSHLFLCTLVQCSYIPKKTNADIHNIIFTFQWLLSELKYIDWQFFVTSLQWPCMKLQAQSNISDHVISVVVLFVELSCWKHFKDPCMNSPVSFVIDVSLCRWALLTVVQSVYSSWRKASTPVAAAVVRRKSLRLCRSQRMGWT